MDLNADHFALFGLPRVFRLAAPALESRYRELQSMIHPDRFANAPARDRRLSLQWATRVNEAYQTLKRPLARARYLLQLAGHDFESENNTLMESDFLVEQMEWREGVAEAQLAGDHHELERLLRRLKHDLDHGYGQLAILLDDRHDLTAAAGDVRRLMFLEKLLDQIEEAVAACEP